MEGLSDRKHQNIFSVSLNGWKKHMLTLALDIKILGKSWALYNHFLDEKTWEVTQFWLYHAVFML